MSRYVYKRLFFAPLITCIFLSLTSQALCLLITVFGPSLCVTYEGAPTQKGDFERPQHPNDEDNSTPLGRILSNALDVGDCSGNATQKSRRLCCVACKPGLMSPCICTPMTPPTVGGDVVRAILVCIGVLVYVLATSPLFFFFSPFWRCLARGVGFNSHAFRWPRHVLFVARHGGSWYLCWQHMLLGFLILGVVRFAGNN